MFGKSFKQKYTGSMVGAGPVVFAVWDYMIAHAEDGTVDVNPTVVSAAIGKMTEADVESALAFLAAPDPRSRSKEEDGRRIVQVGALTWRLVNWEFYRGLHRSEQKRSSDRERQRKWREKNGKSQGVTKRDKPLRNAASQKWSRVPPEWEPSAAHAALAAELGVDLDYQLGLFRDFEFKTKRSDPDATFRTWLKTAAERAAPRRPAPPPGLTRSTGSAAVDRQLARAARLKAEEDAKNAPR